MAAMHCNREEFVSIAKPDCRFSHTLAVYLLRGLLFTKTLRLFVNRLHFGIRFIREVARATTTPRKKERICFIDLRTVGCYGRSHPSQRTTHQCQPRMGSGDENPSSSTSS